jgi:hypothetical protein
LAANHANVNPQLPPPKIAILLPATVADSWGEEPVKQAVEVELALVVIMLVLIYFLNKSVSSQATDTDNQLTD